MQGHPRALCAVRRLAPGLGRGRNLFDSRGDDGCAEGLAQQTILDIARKVGRKAPAEFNSQVENWIQDRRDKKTAGSGIPLTDITD